MLCSKDIELEVGHRQLGDLITLGIPPRLLDGTAELIDGVAVKLSKNIEAGNHLVVVEGFGRPMAEEENSLEHTNGGSADFFLDNWFFRVCGVFGVLVLARGIGLYNRLLAPLVLGLTPGFKGIILGARYQHLSPSQDVVASRPHCKRSSRGPAAVNC